MNFKKIISIFKRRKKLVMTLLVRDEIDIIKYNIDYHLSHGVDFIIATDNGSVDGTRDVLKEYEFRGVLLLIDEKGNDYSQSKWVNRMGVIAYEKYKADIIFHCDADEFWSSKSGNLKNELEGRAEIDIIKVKLTNVLLEDNNGKESFPSDCKWAVVNPLVSTNLEADSKNENLYLFKYPEKVMYKTNNGYLSVIQGNHDVVDKKELTVGTSEDIVIFHYPLRSKNHFYKKIINGGSSYEANVILDKGVGFHWRRWYDSFKVGRLDGEYSNLVLSKKRIEFLQEEDIIKEINFKYILSN